MARPIGTFQTDEQRKTSFLKLTKRDGACLVWIGTKFKSGYGFVRWKGKIWRAHRLAFKLFKGEIPKGGQILHRCDNPPCCEPEHLFLGDPKANSDDKIAKGRMNPEHGADRYNAKLDDDKVRRMRSIFQSGEMNLSELGRLYHVDKSTVRAIILRERWKHIK